MHVLHFLNSTNIQRRYFITAAVLFALCLASYSNIFLNDFFLDDRALIFKRNLLQESQPFFTHFTPHQSPNQYRPISSLILFFQYKLFYDSTVGYHAINLILFYISCVLLFLLAHKLSDDPKMSFIAAALFCVHPINAVVMNFIATNSFTLLGIFLQISALLLLYTDEKNKNKILLYSGASIFFILALLCHPVAVIAPIIFAIMLYHIKKYQIKQTAKICSSFVAIAIFYVAFRLTIANLPMYTLHNFPKLDISFGDYLVGIWRLVGWYVSKLLVPHKVIVIKHILANNATISQQIMAFLGVTCTAIFSVFLLKRKTLISYAALWFILGFIPATVGSLAYPSLGLTVEPHWFFFSSMGFFILTATALIKLEKYCGKNIAITIICALALILLTQTYFYNTLWRQPKKYYNYWLSVSPNDQMALFALGTESYKENNHKRALYYFKKSLREGKYKKNEICYFIGLVSWNLGILDEAKTYFEKTISADPLNLQAYNALGEISIEQRDYEKAEEYFSKAISINWLSYKTIINLTKLYELRGQIKEAINFLEIYPYENMPYPASVQIPVRLSVYYYKKKDIGASSALLNKIVQKDKSPYALFAIGSAFMDMGIKDMAKRFFLKCIEGYPNYKEAYLAYGILLANNKKYDQAIEWWEKGLALDPNDNRMIQNIARAKEILQ